MEPNFSSNERGQSLFRRDPFQALQQEFDNMMNRFTRQWEGSGGSSKDVRVPEVDLVETPMEVRVVMELPGVESHEINLEVVGLRLYVKAEHVDETAEVEGTQHQQERRKACFSRVVDLPCLVREDAAHAVFQNGVLTVTLPKREEEKRHTIVVQASDE
ncbi:Hsp20/alpha crystallin family protein [Thalassoglobus sp. JC818]|uniref:Hsp20/alpha crystallin family protein n=1 Tax=Thalassoglobus sp. JC818 TaxID=3232136 RepID=UPI003458047D